MTQSVASDCATQSRTTTREAAGEGVPRLPLGAVQHGRGRVPGAAPAQVAALRGRAERRNLRACALGVVREGGSVVASGYPGKVSRPLSFKWQNQGCGVDSASRR